MTNLQEYQHGSNPLYRDTDGNGLSDAEEVGYGFSPRMKDTDHDGYDDDWEFFIGTCATNPASVPFGGPAPNQSWQPFLGPYIADVDMDSDNDDGFGPPERDAYEESIEEDCKDIGVNDGDKDRDGIADYVDGYDLLGSATNTDDIVTNETFVPIVFEIDPGLDIGRTTVSVSYCASPPMDATNLVGTSMYAPTSGNLRIWTKLGNEKRNGKATTNGGSYLAPGTYSAHDFGFRVTGAATNHIVTNWVEAVSPSSNNIVFAVNPGGYGMTTSTDVVRAWIIGLDFLESSNRPIRPASQALNVSNFKTDEELPESTAFDDGSTDMDNFRLQVTDGSTGTASEVQVKLTVITNGVSDSKTYTLNKHTNSQYRGEYLRLVTDEQDDAVSNDQTRLVSLGATVRLEYPAVNPVWTKDIQVGRPTNENNNTVSSQLMHDIKQLKVHVVVFRSKTNDAPSATRDQVKADLQTIDERLAQATIRIADKSDSVIDMGTGDQGVALTGALATNGCQITLYNRFWYKYSDDELVVFSHRSTADNTINIFYFDDVWQMVGKKTYIQGGKAYYASVAATSGPKNCIIIDPAVREGRTFYGPLTVAHEIMHILRNLDNRSTPDIDLLNAPDSHDKSIGHEKRIGPYPSAGTGNDDTTTIRAAAEALP